MKIGTKLLGEALLKNKLLLLFLVLLFPSFSYAAEFKIPTTIFTDMNNDLSNYISHNMRDYVSRVSKIFMLLMGACFSFYFVYKWALIHYRGSHIAFEDMMINGLKLMFIMTGLGGSGWYLENIVPFIMNVGDEVAVKIINPQHTALSGLEAIVQNINMYGSNISKQIEDISLFSLKIGVCITSCISLIGVYIGGTIFVIYAAGTLMVAKFMVGLLLIIGPLYLMMAMYEQTISFTKQWIGQAFNYILLNVFVTLTLHILMGFINRNFEQSTEMPVDLVLYYLIAMMMGVYLIGQIPSLVSSITGGVGINGLVGATNQTGRMIYSTGALAARGGYSVAARAASSGKQALQQLRGNIRGG